MVVSGSRHPASQQITVFVYPAQQGRYERDEATVFVLRFPRHEQVSARVRVQTPVVVLAISVDTRKRLLVEENRKFVIERQVVKHLHCQDVGVCRRICQMEDRRDLMLRWRHFIVGAVDRNPQLPHLLPRLSHISIYPRRQFPEVEGRQLLPAKRRGSYQSASGCHQIWPSQVLLPVDQKELLLPSDITHDLLRSPVSQVLQQSHALLGYRLVRSQ